MNQQNTHQEKRRRKFFEEQYWYAENVLCSYFDLPSYQNIKTLEIGGGENGALKYFDEQGAETYGIEISQSRVDYARAQLRDTKISLQQGDITNPEIIDQLPPVELIILRDVIEHIDDKKSALSNMRKLLTPDGLIFISFPPKYSPYAGHQQNIKGKLKKIPYMHLLPSRVYKNVLKVVADSDARVEALMDTHKTMISIHSLEELFQQVHLKIHRKDYFLVRPCYQKRFGVTPRQTFLNKLPVLRETFSLGALYTLSK